MPSDVTGQLVIDPGADGGGFHFRPGPVFTNVLLADEINRTPPKTQASLLEAMEERQVTVEGAAHPLPEPFIVIATQNPIEYEGTYPLPEAQLDRFLFKLSVGYPSAEQEQEVLARHDRGLDPHDTAAAGVRPVANAADIVDARRQIQALRVEPPILAYIVAIARATRGAVGVPGRVAPRGGHGPARGEGVGLAVGAPVRHPRRGSRPWSSRACATASRSGPSSSWRGRRSTASSTACWPRSRCHR